MGTETFELILIEFVPSPLREVRIPIGLFLFDSSHRLFRHSFTRDWRRVRSLEPQAELGVLADLPAYFDRLIEESLAAEAPSQKAPVVGRFYEQLRRMQEAQSGAVQISLPTRVRTANPDEEFKRLFQKYIE